jgi:hypothetical protein
VAASGLVTYLSKPYGGRASDKAIFNLENLLSKLDPHDAIMVDKGFLIETECAKANVKLKRPPFLRKKNSCQKKRQPKRQLLQEPEYMLKDQYSILNSFEPAVMLFHGNY